MNWFKNNNMVLVNVKLVLNIGSDVLLFPFQIAANWGMKKCRYCCGECAFHLYYLVGFGWDFFSVYHIENHSMYVIQHSLVKVLNWSVLLYWKMWAFCMRLNTFRNTEKGANRKVPSAAFHAFACIGDCPAYGCASQLFWFWNSSVVTLAPGWKEIDIWKTLKVF